MHNVLPCATSLMHAIDIRLLMLLLLLLQMVGIVLFTVKLLLCPVLFIIRLMLLPVFWSGLASASAI